MNHSILSMLPKRTVKAALIVWTRLICAQWYPIRRFMFGVEWEIQNHFLDWFINPMVLQDVSHIFHIILVLLQTACAVHQICFRWIENYSFLRFSKLQNVNVYFCPVFHLNIVHNMCSEEMKRVHVSLWTIIPATNQIMGRAWFPGVNGSKMLKRTSQQSLNRPWNTEWLKYACDPFHWKREAFGRFLPVWSPRNSFWCRCRQQHC